MKKLILVVASLVAVALSAQAVTTPGSINFNNKVSGTASVNAPVFDVGGVNKLDGANFLAQLYAGPTADALVAVGAAVPFRTGSGAGYWNPAPDSTRTVPTVEAGQNAYIKVVAWDKGTANYATYEAAKAGGAKAGESAVFQVKTGGDGAPPALPGVMTAMQSFSMVPEPSTIALALLGVAGLLIYRRK